MSSLPPPAPRTGPTGPTKPAPTSMADRIADLKTKTGGTPMGGTPSGSMGKKVINRPISGPKGPGPTVLPPQVSRPPTSPTSPTALPTQVSRPPAPVKPSVPQPGQPKFMGEAPATMKKGGYVTKDGRLNLGSGRVSTATKNKKSPNF